MQLNHTPHILIVDDEPSIAIAIEFLMQQQGYITAYAKNGVDALQLLSSYTPDIIILDVMMPELSGFELATRIRQQEKFSDVQIIFLTAKGTTRDKLEGYGSGGDIYLTKPFDNQHLIDTVENLLN